MNEHQPPAQGTPQIPPQPYPQYPPQPGQPGAPQYVPASTEVPGQTTGIIGLVLVFVGLAPIGLILSIISVVQASKGRASKALGIVGIVLNALAILLIGLWLALVVFATYFGIQERAKESLNTSAVSTISRNAEAYYAKDGKYPQKVQDFAKYPESTLSIESVTLTDMTPRDSTTIMYRSCADTGAEIAYYSDDKEAPVSRYLGSGSESTCR